jgi:hypothetical protein
MASRLLIAALLLGSSWALPVEEASFGRVATVLAPEDFTTGRLLSSLQCKVSTFSSAKEVFVCFLLFLCRFLARSCGRLFFSLFFLRFACSSLIIHPFFPPFPDHLIVEVRL